MFVYVLCDGDFNNFRDDFNIIGVYSTMKKAREARKTMIETWKHGNGMYRAITNPDYFEIQKIEVE